MQKRKAPFTGPIQPVHSILPAHSEQLPRAALKTLPSSHSSPPSFYSHFLFLILYFTTSSTFLSTLIIPSYTKYEIIIYFHLKSIYPPHSSFSIPSFISVHPSLHLSPGRVITSTFDKAGQVGHKKFMLVMPESHLLSLLMQQLGVGGGTETERVREVERERGHHIKGSLLLYRLCPQLSALDKSSLCFMALMKPVLPVFKCSKATKSSRCLWHRRQLPFSNHRTIGLSPNACIYFPYIYFTGQCKNVPAFN